MRILVIYRHYWPDTTPYATLLRAMLERLVDDGHTVDVITAQPSYNDLVHPRQPRLQQLDGVTIRRLTLLPERKRRYALRLINFCWFLLRAVLHAIWHRRGYDLVIGSSHPPVLMGVALRAIRRWTGIPFIYHCQDLQPECMALARRLRPAWIVQLLTAVDTQTCQDAEAVIVLSDDMRRTMVERGVPDGKVAVINNFSLYYAPQPVPVPPEFQHAEPDTFRVLFAGNMGAFQALDRIVAAAHLLSDHPEIQFYFMGQGAQKPHLRHQARKLLGTTVHFYDHQPREVAFCYMAACDLGIVSLEDELYRVAFPSKMMTYLAAGLPVLAVVEPHSELAHLVRSNRLGFVAHSRSPYDIAISILQARDALRAQQVIRREQLRVESARLFGRAQMLDRWSELIRNLDDPMPAEAILPYSSPHCREAA